jgi:hypothetical protein
MRSSLIAIALTALPITAHAQEPAETPRCFDVAVVARLVRETPEPIPDLGPDVIVIRWPWVLEFETEDVVIGRVDRRRLRVTASMHTNFNQQIDHFLLLLRRDPDRGYIAEDIIVNVVRDRRGRFIIPFDGPVEEEGLRPEAWLPANYESYLRPVRYRNLDAWWLSEQYVDDESLAETPPGWHTWRDGRVVALRGLYLSDLPSMMAQEAGALCER